MRSGVAGVEREGLVEMRGGLAPLTEAIIAQAEVVVQARRGLGAAKSRYRRLVLPRAEEL